MPKIFQYLSFILRFYSNEHLPIHVHVQIQEREVKVEFTFEENVLSLLFKNVKGKEPLTNSEAKEVSVFLKIYYKEIIDKWNKVFIYHQKVEFEIIKEKLKRKKI
jgi:hypothetical protein